METTIQQMNGFCYEDAKVANKHECGAFISELLCGVCNMILNEPLECKQCEKAICRGCMNQWIARKDVQCPYCRNKSVFGKVNRMTRNLLAKLQFKCTYEKMGCKEVLTYENLFKHQNECPTIYFKCSDCNFSGRVDNQSSHSCIQYLKTELSGAKETITSLSNQLSGKASFKDKMFYFAKLNQHAFYDFDQMRWHNFKVYDRKISEGKIVVINKENILIIGGYETDNFDWAVDQPSKDILTFHIPSKKFNKIGQMMNNRIYFGIAQEEEIVYVIGGSLKGQDLRSCETFNVENRVNDGLPNLAQPYRGPTCTTFQKRYVYAVGYEVQHDRTSMQQLDMERGSWIFLTVLSEHRIWLVGLHMVDENSLILFGGQAINDNNQKYSRILKYTLQQNRFDVLVSRLVKDDKFFFNNQNIVDKNANCIYSMGRDYIHKVNLNKMSCFIPDVGYVEYYT